MELTRQEATSRREVGEAVVAAVRERSGGLLGVAAMALPHEGGIEVGARGVRSGQPE